MSVSNVLSPTPVRLPLKRAFVKDFDPELERAPKRRWPSAPATDWLSNILPLLPPSPLPLHRTESAPPKVDYSKIPSFLFAAIDDLDNGLKSLVPIDEMLGDQGDASSEQGSTLRPLSRLKIRTSDPKYRSVLDNNYIYVDRSGMEAPEAIKNMIQTQLYKRRKSPPLSQEVLFETVKHTDQWAGSTDNVVNRLLDTPMFPLDRPGLALGGNSQWPSAGLPTNPEYSNHVALPKPDFHVGYSIGRRSEWSSREADVIDHQHALPYTQPGTGNRLPFLTLELKSEATGGTLWHAENQAAGSGTFCVKAMQWLLGQATALGTSSMVDTVAFSVSATARQVVFYIHYYSEERGAYLMSYINSYMTTDPQHIQQCHDLVKNIVDLGLGMRQNKLRECLKTLYPQIDTKWKRDYDAIDQRGPPTPATALTT